MYQSPRLVSRSVSLLLTWMLGGCLVLLARPAAAKVDGGYVDLLLAEGVGELGAQQYDVYRQRDGNETFVGNLALDRRHGTLLAAGFGLRLAFAIQGGLRISGEGSVQGGRLVGASDAALLTSTVTRGELLAGIGYQVALGPLVLHTSGLLGGDYQSLHVAPAPVAMAALTTSAAVPAPTDDELTLRRWGLRLGLQVGAHVQLTKLAALYGDATIDYDGQWRTRFGIAVGEPGRRHR